MKLEDHIKFFGLNNLSIEAELRKVSEQFEFQLKPTKQTQESETDKIFYPQFREKIRKEAETMARHYVVFYCLENSIRELICSRLEEIHGANWWDLAVPQAVRDNVEKNFKKEQASGITMRSDKKIDYSNFGELGEIIKSNWDIFGDMLRDAGAVQRILGNINTLRASIAHCSILAEDEILRLHLALRDWFRQMS